MSDVTSEHLAQSIVPKSDQLNADDLLMGPRTVTITAVKASGTKEQPIVIELADGLRPYKPCKTMRRILIAHFGDDAKKWIGQRLTLYTDPSVTYGGVKVGGIRISHASGLTEPKTFIVTKARSNRDHHTLLPIPPEQPYVDDVLAEIAAAESTETLAAIGFILKTKSKAIQDAVRGAYTSKKKALETITKGE